MSFDTYLSPTPVPPPVASERYPERETGVLCISVSDLKEARRSSCFKVLLPPRRFQPYLKFAIRSVFSVKYSPSQGVILEVQSAEDA